MDELDFLFLWPSVLIDPWIKMVVPFKERYHTITSDVSIYHQINVACVTAANYQFAIHMVQTKNAHSKKQNSRHANHEM